MLAEDQPRILSLLRLVRIGAEPRADPVSKREQRVDQTSVVTFKSDQNITKVRKVVKTRPSQSTAAKA